jgi:RNA polymerase sigma factor (TIGR02999 family)
MDCSQKITILLHELRAGKKEAESQLIEAVYPQLRKMAGRYIRGERPGHTLQATALVHEAYLQLLGQTDKQWENRAHFFAVASQVMRRILVDYARQKKAKKRDGARQRVELSEGIALSEDRLEEILAIDEALRRLEAWDARQCRVVELRFFSGLTEDEIALVLGVAPRTVKRDWNVARAWLHGELKWGATHGQSVIFELHADCACAVWSYFNIIDFYLCYLIRVGCTVHELLRLRQLLAGVYLNKSHETVSNFQGDSFTSNGHIVRTILLYGCVTYGYGHTLDPLQIDFVLSLKYVCQL